MLKSLYDRSAFALIGAVFGAALGAVLWFLYDAGFSSRLDAPVVHIGIRNWVLWTAGAFAVLGFIFKAGAGGSAGGTLHEVHDFETGRDSSIELPGWLAALVLIGVAVVVWYLVR